MSRRHHRGAGALALALLVVVQASTGSAASTAVRLTPAQEQAMGLRTALAATASMAPLATLPAIATPPLNGRVVASAPFAGTVVRVDVLEGQSVIAGQRLAVLFSQDALRVGSELAQARAEAGVAGAAARRTRTLAEEGIIAGARAEEAQARATQAQALVNEKRRLLDSSGGATGRPGEYALRAPIAGRVSQLNLQPGGGVAAMAPAVVIDRDDRLWIEARLPANLIGKVIVGAPVEIEGQQGRVIAASSAIDPRTRSAILRAELPRGSSLVPGRATSVTVMGRAPAGSVTIPRPSVVQVEGRDTVFLKTADGYASQPVTVHGVSSTQAVVSGLKAGARVASAGVSQLKAAAGR